MLFEDELSVRKLVHTVISEQKIKKKRHAFIGLNSLHHQQTILNLLYLEK